MAGYYTTDYIAHEPSGMLLTEKSAFIFIFFTFLLIIPVTRRVKGYTRFVGKYVTGRLLPVTYFLTNLVYPFTLRVTGIKTLFNLILNWLQSYFYVGRTPTCY